MIMSIIIRLQNLPLEANSLDIRRFFQGLHIPDGGVHIVGGENGDAFIAFGTDEDARQAMERNGNPIKGSRIKLLLSSRNEMQRVIDAARNQTMSTNGLVQSQQQPPIVASQPKPMINVVGPPQPSTGQYPSLTAQQQQQPPPPQQQSYPSSGPAMSQTSTQVSGYYQQSYGMINSQSNDKDSYREGPPPPGFRTRSRSRSRSPPIRRSYNEPPPSASSSSSLLGQSSQSANSSMHSGLLGSLTSASQQMPLQYPNSSYQNPSNIYHQEGPPPPIRDSFGYSGDGGRYPAPSLAPNNSSNINEHQPPPQSQYSSDHWNQSDDRFRASAPGIGGVGGSDDMFRKMDSLHQSHPSINNNNINNSNTNSYGGNTGQQQPQPGYGHHQQQQQYLNNSNNNSGSMDPLIQPAAQSQFLPQTMPPSSSSQPQSNNVRMFTLQLFDLPLNVRPIDLIKFFHPLFLNEDNIKIFYDEKGFPTGMALVRFPSPREFETALGLNNRYLGERQIQIRPLDEMNGPVSGSSSSNSSSVPNNQINSSVPLISQKPLLKQNSPLMPTPPSAGGNGGEPYRSDNYLPYRNPPSFNNHGPSSQPGPPPPPPMGHRRKELVLYMKGLPFKNCSPKDVAGFFHPIKLANIKIEMDARDKPTGNAFVEFHDQTDLDRGMEYNMKHMGRRYIELIPLLMFEKYGPNYHSAPPPPKHGRPVPPITYCVSVRGLSKHITSKDLKAYFAKADAETYAVHIMLTPERMNAGEAFLEFINKDNQMRALKMNGCYMGGDRITVRHVPYETVRKAVPPLSRAGEGFNSYPPAKIRSLDSKYRDRSIGSSSSRIGPPAFFEKATILIAKNISMKVNEKDLCAFFSNYHITTNRIKLRDDPDDSNDPQSSSSPTQMAQISFLTKADAEHAQRNIDKKYLMERRIHLTFA